MEYSALARSPSLAPRAAVGRAQIDQRRNDVPPSPTRCGEADWLSGFAAEREPDAMAIDEAGENQQDKAADDAAAPAAT